MNRTTMRELVMVVLLGAAAGSMSALAQTGTTPSDKPASQGQAGMGAMHSQGGMMDMHGAMMKGMQQMQSMPMTGDTDRDFATMMRMHHQGALDMAEVELKNGKDAQLKRMARRIIEAQKKEIKEFDDWLAKHNK